MSEGDVPIPLPRPRPERPEDQLQNANQAASQMPASEAGACTGDCPQGFKLEYKSRYTEQGQTDTTPNRYTKEVWVPAKEFIFLIGQDRKISVRTNPPQADAEWEVKPIGSHSGTPTPNKGKGAEFTFVPKVTASQRPVQGSKTRNQPVGYEITVKLTSGRSATLTEKIEQDVRDIIRQEYVDYRSLPAKKTSLHVPYRDQIVTAPRQEFLNNNNYAADRVVLNSGMLELLEAVEAEYGETVTVNSSWRCPQRNKAVGGVPNSNHQHGGAIDMKPNGYTAGTQAGRIAMLNLYRAALRAKDNAGGRMVLLERNSKALHTGNTDLPQPNAANPDKNSDGLRDNDAASITKLNNASHVHIDKEPPGGGNDD
ncbi:D-Ala-D-Ala carboxypeptidase family metallohydrolase [Polyangium spumosum]|uniref:Peptidase M15A C-terminal domain-containing protein n=1 Tax=Polyangium spumosum TaxID=889282 RepID=A0A6N7PXD7_9BACT|nr:D-Ala-D-Ala carboxypeptidase family metallohydrolase [Polyangium spumosum]MRG96748.1 hypothetical protein [Polyangium spumosum]